MNVTRTLFSLTVFIAIIFLQIFLSKRESRWPGLILPTISFVISLLYPLYMVIPPEDVTNSFVLEMIASFLLANIPTIILLGIYFGCREKPRRKKQL